MKCFKSFLLIFFLSAAQYANSQTAQVDSLRSILKGLVLDTTRVNILNQIASSLYRTENQKAIDYGQEAKNLAEQIDYQKGLALAYKNIGLGNYMQGKYMVSVANWETSLKIYETLEDEKGIANLVSNLGAVYYTLGQNYEALEYSLRSLRIAENQNDSIRIATLYMNIGNIYSEQPTTLDTARNYYLRALHIGNLIGYTDLLGLTAVNLGETFFKQQNYDSALYYSEKALLSLTSNVDIAASLSTIGKIYSEKEEYQTAIKYLQDALALTTEENAQLEGTRILLGLASTYYRQGDTQEAIHYYELAREKCVEMGLYYELSDVFEGLALCNARLSHWQKAYEFMYLQDTVDQAMYKKIEAEDQTNSLMFTYQMEKKENEIEILEKVSEIEQLKAKRQKAIIITIGAFGLLIFLLALGFYSRMRFIRKTNQQINAQKNEIEAQRDLIQAAHDQIQAQHDLVFSQKEMITDSISYAQRIQSAMLPSTDLLNSIMPEYFLVYKPKDIVSGDFYWVKEVEGHLVIVGADCTGHGVPGGFMSMLGMTLLNDLISHRCFDAPSAILERLRAKIKELLEQSGNGDEQKDGMDAVIAILNKNNHELLFSGANNPLYIVRNKAHQNGRELDPYFSTDNGNYQLFELKGDKQPIGYHWSESKFKTHFVKLQEQDSIYIFSDGIVDQFGGEGRKKFKTLNFKKLLLSIQDESMVKQGQIIEDTYEKWRGDIEQIDDVSVIGFRI